VARRYGFREYDGPPLEPLELYTVKSGDEIVGQLYNFTDKGERAVALRPEMTPTLARLVAAHERHYKKPIKWFALPQLFRYERQQKGRLREHFQFNADIFSEPDPAVDAELVALLIDSLRAFGLTADDFVLRLSSRDAWQSFYENRQGDPTQAYSFFQVIDKLEREAKDQTETKLRALGFSLDEVLRFIHEAEPVPALAAILQNLQARGLAEFVKIDYNVIRGLAYYSGAVFEAFDKKGDFRAIAGGGRYDHLVKLISGGKVDLPAIGFGMGDVVLTELLKQRKLLPPFGSRIDVVVLIEEEARRGESLHFVQQLRDATLAVDYAFNPLKPDKQFKRAIELNAGFTAKIELDEAKALVVRVKNLKTRAEQTMPPSAAVEWFKQQFGTKG